MRDEQGRRWWRRLGRKKQAVWPRMEQGQYRSYRAVHPFDERFGVDTSGLLYDLPSGHHHDRYNNGYFAVAPSVFHAVMAAMAERLHLDCSRFRFVDLGSGKGRALLLASDYPFREVIGIELSPELDRIARANIARYGEAAGPDALRQMPPLVTSAEGVGRRDPDAGALRRPPVTSIQGDATEFLWPPGPLVIYMWNAFTRPVLEQVFHNLEVSWRAAPREVYVVYMHPELESTLASLPWLALVSREEFAMSEEDFAAWAFPTHAELCSIYHAGPEVASVGFPADTKVQSDR